MGIISKVISTVRKIDGIYTMMEGAVKKIDEVYIFVEGKRHLVFPESTLIFEKTTPGAYEFTVPEKYNYVAIEYAGASGGNGVQIFGGKGSIKKENLRLQQFHISGVIGASGGRSYVSSSPSSNGGAGYNNGSSGQVASFGGSKWGGGGGGGSTSVVVNNLTYEASAGGGVSSFGAGGKGGGQYGGTGGASNEEGTPSNPGNNATDPNQIGLNSGDGYVKIYGIAG